jgi:flagellar basal body-associated protein FliL
MAKLELIAPVSAKAPPTSDGGRGWILMIAICLVSSVTGFAVPAAFLNTSTAAGATSILSYLPLGQHNQRTARAAGRNLSGQSRTTPAASDGQPVFVPFGDVVVNLAEERLTRHLRATLALQVDPVNEELVRKSVDRKKTILKNWLIAYLSDKELEEVRGAIGVNQARREIQEQFNRLLFANGKGLIQEVLFEEFTVQ